MFSSNKWKIIVFVLIVSFIFVTYMMVRNTQTIGNLTSQLRMYAKQESSAPLQSQYKPNDNVESFKKLSEQMNDLYKIINKERSRINENSEFKRIISTGKLTTTRNPTRSPPQQASKDNLYINTQKLESYMTEGLQRLKNMPANSMSDVEHRYYNTTYYDDGKCGPNYKYYGPSGDGGYTVCLSGPFKLKKGDCIVYDFGINNMWQFDEEIVRDHNCHVYAFDPTMGVADHKRGHNISFYSIGISGNPNDRRWSRVKTLKGILDYLQHTNTVIDLMKFDIEWSEWDLLETIMREGSFKNIKQIIFESHVNFENENFENFRKRANILIELRKTGMRQWRHRDNQWRPNIRRSKHTGIDRICCVEHSMVNSNFQD